MNTQTTLNTETQAPAEAPAKAPAKTSTKTPAKPRRNPPVRSMLALRVMATAFTLVSFGGMTVYAAGHAKPANATLAPTVLSAAAPQTTATGRLRLSPQTPVTAQPPVTSTRVS